MKRSPGHYITSGATFHTHKNISAYYWVVYTLQSSKSWYKSY